jgi:hypothetical protein
MAWRAKPDTIVLAWTGQLRAFRLAERAKQAMESRALFSGYLAL